MMTTYSALCQKIIFKLVGDSDGENPVIIADIKVKVNYSTSVLITALAVVRYRR